MSSAQILAVKHILDGDKEKKKKKKKKKKVRFNNS